METKRAHNAIEQVALRHGVSVEEVLSQMNDAMAKAMANTKNDPIAQGHWQKMSPYGETPTPENLITYIANYLQNSL